jgi:DNA-binding phage protein
MASGNVLPFPGAVNSLLTDMAGSSTPGRNLERYVRERWRAIGGKRGMVGLCAAAGVTREALYGWFRGDVEPRLGNLSALAEALHVERAELVAAMDGYDLAAAQREVIAREVEAAVAPLRQLMRDAGLLPAAKAPAAMPRGARPPRERVA